jgi:hypothetical protein
MIGAGARASGGTGERGLRAMRGPQGDPSGTATAVHIASGGRGGCASARPPDPGTGPEVRES